MHYYGLDSLVLVLSKMWTRMLPSFDILGGTSISVLVIVASRTKSVKTTVVEGLKGDGDRALGRNAKLSFEMNKKGWSGLRPRQNTSLTSTSWRYLGLVFLGSHVIWSFFGVFK